jgi:MFS family permease
MEVRMATGLVGQPMRRPRLIHAAILLVTSGLTTLATAILGPSLPRMQAHFSGAAHADYLVPLTLTVPMLAMAALSIFAGSLADRYGRKRMLVWSTAIYAVCGTAPLWLETLPSIFASRALLGVTEAVLMTVSTTMIGDYFAGERRARYMALQTTVASGSAFVLNNLGGAMGELGWRAPYWMYAVSVPLALLMAVYLWEPKNESGPVAHVSDEPGVTFRVHRLVGICAIAVLVGISFMIVPVHLGYLFTAIAVHSPSAIGVAFGLNSLGVMCGTLCFGWIVAPRFSVAGQLALATFVAGLGFAGMAIARSYQALLFAAIVNGFGAGLLLPTAVTWNMRELPFAHRGLGVGAFQSSLFFGMFLNPILVVALERTVGSRASAVGIVGIAFLLASCVGLIAVLRSRAIAGVAGTDSR